MTPASLGPALFTPPPPDAGATVTTDSGPGTGDGGFARLLQPATTPASAASTTPGTEQAPVTMETASADDDFPALDTAGDNSEDAPWPPPGLEALLVMPPPQAAMPPAAPVLPDTSVPSTAPVAQAGSALPATTAPSIMMAPALQAAQSAIPGATPAQEHHGTVSAAQLAASAPAALLPDTAGVATAARAGAALPGMARLAVPELELPAGDPTATAALADEAIAGLLAGNPADAMPLAAMAALGATAGASPLPAADAQASVVPTRADMGGEHFDQDVAEGVQYMLDNKLQSARIRISPQHLGMIEVELRLDGDRVHANFSSAQSEVRQALNDSLPRLRELLDAQGLEMGQTAVADQGRDRPSAGGQDSNGTGNTPASGTTLAGSAAGEAASTPAWRHQGLLDAYA